MRADSEPFVLYVREGPPEIGDDLPDEYSFTVWTPTMRHPVPATLNVNAAVWTSFHACGLFANSGYRVVYIRFKERIVHRSCVLPRYFRWPFMGENDLQVSSTWTDPEFRSKGLASSALAHILRTMTAARRRFWYVSRESNMASIRVCRRVGFQLFAYGTRGTAFGLRSLGQLKLLPEPPRHDVAEKPPLDMAADWYARYYSRVGADRNDLRVNRGALFQTIASERSLIRAFYHIPLKLSGLRVLDVGCGAGGAWYQLFRLGVKPQEIVGIDLQRQRLASVGDLYPQCTAIHADAAGMPFADASFDLVYESTMFATLPDDGIRARIAAEMLRVCTPGGFLLLVDWRTPKLWDKNYKALTRAEVRKLFAMERTTSLVGIYPGALVPPVGRLLSKYAGPLYFLIACFCPPLVGQVAYLLRKHSEPALNR
ncbi:MAG TPA: bifunctional GNAT family N-acetyltransferase/class I SAM-dependent methyltransferase [Bryobacteraceae bacterium]|nr:bifunctional GNAT family N-acetyltransferase/class I SAM-dependent methyltransferase [Bryobacteraceae bacterium]